MPPFVFHLSRGLAKLGHDVHVLAPHAAGAALREDFEGVRVHRFRYAPAAYESLAYGGGILSNLRVSRTRWLLVPSFLAAQWAATIQLVRRHKVDVIHAHWMVPQGVVAALAGPVTRRPLVVSGHGSDINEMRRGARLRMLTLAARRADGCTTVSRALQQELLRLTGVDLVVVPMGVDPVVFPAVVPRSGLQIRSSPRILFAGRLVSQKGVRYLIEAVSLLRRTYPATKLQIVGEGPDRPELEASVRDLDLADSVIFTGAVGHSRMPALLAGADIFVLPSIRMSNGDTEGLGVALLEAAASELPVVASAIGGLPDLVENRRSGMLVEPADPPALASALTELLSNDPLRRSVAQNARRLAIGRFSWDAVVGQFDAILRAHVGAARS